MRSEIGKCEASNFILLFEDSFGYSGSLESHRNFKIVFSMSAKNDIGVCMWIALSLKITE